MRTFCARLLASCSLSSTSFSSSSCSSSSSSSSPPCRCRRRRRCVHSMCVCVCVCVCARARARACVHVCSWGFFFFFLSPSYSSEVGGKAGGAECGGGGVPEGSRQSHPLLPQGADRKAVATILCERRRGLRALHPLPVCRAVSSAERCEGPPPCTASYAPALYRILCPACAAPTVLPTSLSCSVCTVSSFPPERGPLSSLCCFFCPSCTASYSQLHRLSCPHSTALSAPSCTAPSVLPALPGNHLDRNLSVPRNRPRQKPLPPAPP
jgi:hypothetical protein